MKGKYFFGWTNFKYVAKQLYFTFTDKPSELSAKRIERALFILSGLTAWWMWFFWNYKILVVSEMILATGVLFTYAGYTLTKTEKEKSAEYNKSEK